MQQLKPLRSVPIPTNFIKNLQIIQILKKIIGRGEAASISFAKEKQGILASNNLRDISAYVTEYGLTHLTTGDILKMALDAGYIDESQGNTIWANMIARKRKLGYASFSDYLAVHQPE